MNKGGNKNSILVLACINACLITGALEGCREKKDSKEC
jgi:hypothetical protein